MTYRRFEDLPVWQAAIELAVQTFAITSDPAFPRGSGLRDQIERAAVSVSNNIAEGFERGTNAELLTFLYIARGSAGEVRSMTHLLRRLLKSPHLESAISDLESRAESTSRQLGAWTESLKNSEMRGTRHQNDATRRASNETKRRESFLSELRRMTDQARKPVDRTENPDGHNGDAH